MAAVVYAQRIGETLCRLCVALRREQRWEVMTQEDDDQAHTLW
jgi:hypothetical protein